MQLSVLPSARYSDPKFNRILKDDVVRVFERYMALPGPLGRYSQDFYLQMKAETTARLPVRPIRWTTWLAYNTNILWC